MPALTRAFFIGAVANMSWIWLALLYPLIFTIVTFFDKFLVSLDEDIQWGLPSFTMIAGFVVGVIFISIPSFQMPSTTDFYILLFVGILNQISSTLYFQAINQSDANTIIINMQTLPIIGMILAYLFLGETISFVQLLGFFIIIFSTLYLSQVKNENRKFSITSIFKQMIIINFIMASSNIAFKFTSSSNNFISAAGIQSIGVSIGGIIIHASIPKIRNTFNRIVKEYKKIKYYIIISESLYTVGKLIALLAFTLGPIALVSVFESTSIFYGIILGIIFTKFLPSFFNDPIDKKSISNKLFWSLLLFSGIWLIK